LYKYTIELILNLGWNFYDDALVFLQWKVRIKNVFSFN